MSPAVDSHCHVFDVERCPYPPDASYRPAPHEAGTSAHLSAVHDAHGISHALLVNPTNGYGFDNRCMLEAIRAGGGRFRGIARVRPDADARTLAALASGGVVGLRLDLIGAGVAVLADGALPRLFAQVRELGWLVQVQCEGDQLHDSAATLRAARVPLVFDHCGRPDATRGVEQPGFRALLDFGRDGHAVKLSGPFRFPHAPPLYYAAEPFAAALLDAFTVDRCVWGSDWPFIRVPARIDYGPVRALLDRWVPDAADRRRVLWDTPARQFGFVDASRAAARPRPGVQGGQM